MHNLFFLFLVKECKTYLFNSNKSWFAIAFFLLCILIFPLSFGAETKLLSQISVSSIWVCAFFANLISLESIFKDDYQSGLLLQYNINKIPLSVVVVTKLICHWIFTGLPIILLSPFFLIFLSESYNNILGLLLSLLLGTPLFSLIGMPISALTLGVSSRGPLLIFLTIPFFLPIIIFGVLSVNSFNLGSFSEYYLLCAMFSLGVIFMPYITIRILKEGLE